VFVWQNPDLSRDIIVRPDGKVSFPLAGDVDASGLTLTQVDEAITKRLRTYIRFPDVSLAIKRFGGTKTLILGEVFRPGVYIPAGQGRILELVAMASGFTPVANQRNVILIRGGLASPEIFKLDLESALKQGRLADNMMLQPDDIVYVPKSGISSIMDFMEQFYPTLQQVLVGQSIAKNFGISTTISGGGEVE
jgi:polysaccharide export outer membrane protein